MALFPVTDSTAGPRVTLNEFLKDPMLIREVVLQMTKHHFLADELLRDAGTTPAGVIRYRESSPLYANSDPQTRAEFGEVAIAEISEGEGRVSFVEETALAAVISDEMVRRMRIDALQRQLIRIRNSMVRAYNRNFVNMIFNHPSVQQVAVTTPWSDPNSTVRQDIYEGVRLIEEANASDLVGGEGIDSEFEFEADTIVIGRGTRADLLGNETFNKIYEHGDKTSEHMLYTGRLPNRILTLDPLVSSAVPAGKALVLQRKICGFIADELPLQVSPMYRIEERKMARADVQRASAMGLDQPLAVAVLDGV
jgi:hypothetical protein